MCQNFIKNREKIEFFINFLQFFIKNVLFFNFYVVKLKW